MKYFTAIIYLSLILVVSSCGEDNDELPVTLPSTAKITGSVNLYDEGTEKIGASGMKVSVAGISISVLTDSEGKFELIDVPFGPTTLVYEKEDYGTYKYFISDFKADLFIGEAPSLGKKSKTKSITSGSVIDGTDVKISVVTEGTNTSKRYMRYFLGTDQTVTNENYSQVTEIYENDANTNPSQHTFTQQELNDLGFSSGSQVFVKAYGESFWGNDFEDPDLNKRIFPNLNENSAQPVMFMVP